MRHSFTATTTAQSIPANLFATWLLPQHLEITNLWVNPVFYTNNGTATATTCNTVLGATSRAIMLTQPFDSFSFITTGGNSVVVLETF